MLESALRLLYTIPGFPTILIIDNEEFLAYHICYATSQRWRVAYFFA